MKRLLCGAGSLLAAVLLLVSGAPARAALQSNSLNNTVSPALVCSGPWVDVKCYGALGNDTQDDTSAITSAIADALSNGLPLRISPGTYKVTSALTINTVGFGAAGFRIEADNATIDATGVASGPALLIEHTGGSPGSPAVDTGFTLSGALAVNCNVAAYCAQIGETNFADEFKGAHIDGLVVDNLSTSTSAGGLKVNYLVGSKLSVSGYSAGGAASVAGLAIEQMQDSTLGGSGSTAGASAAALLIENGHSTGDTITGFNYASNGSGAVSNTCLSITTASAFDNQFGVPQGGCTTGMNAPNTPAGPQNIMLGQNFTGTNLGPSTPGISMVGRGSLNRFSAPAVSSYTAAGSDDGNVLSPANATGSSLPPNWPAGNHSLAVTLPSAAAVGSGWTMGFVSSGSNVITLSGTIIAPNGQTLSSMTVGADGGGGGEFVTIKSDGASLRLSQATPATMLYNGLVSAMPTLFTYPSSAGYAATLGDNGHWISSSLAGGTLTITLPSITAIPVGWTIGGWVDAGNDVIFHTNSVSGGAIETSSGSSFTTYDLTNFSGSRSVLTFDGANFREVTNTSGGGVVAGAITAGSVENALGFTPINGGTGLFTNPVKITGSFPAFNWSGTNGSWQTAIDIANSPALSDFVLADKCTGTPGPSCPSVIDQIYDSNNQDGAVAFAVVSGGAAYNVGDWIRFNSGCTLNPAAVVTAETGGVVTALAPYYIGGYGRCATDPVGTQSQQSTSGSGSGLTATFTMTTNMPSLGIGQSPSAEYTSLTPMYELVIKPQPAEPLRGGIMIVDNGATTGDPLDVWNGTIGSPQFSIDTAGDVMSRGYFWAFQTLDSPPGAIGSGGGLMYGSTSQGLSLIGNGSSYDAALLSSNGQVALAIEHGTTQVTLPHGALIVQPPSPAPSFSAGQGALYGGTTTGLNLSGVGSANDITGLNRNGAVVFQVPTGTQNFQVPTEFISGTGAQAAVFDSSGDLTTAGYQFFNLTGTSVPAAGTNGEGSEYTTAADGFIQRGKGSIYDQTFLNGAGSVALAIQDSGSNILVPIGSLDVGSSATASLAGVVDAYVGYYAANVAGLTCSGTPTSSFATVGGIVTHC
jgi:hypothetical protein